METNKSKSYVPMLSVTVLFFMWGFITSLNDILIPYLKSVYSLSHFEANIVQFAFFIAYFVGSLVFYLLSKKGKDTISLYGYKTTLVIGLMTASVACLIFALSAYLQMGFAVFLAALFLLGLGLTFANSSQSFCGTYRQSRHSFLSPQSFAGVQLPRNNLGTGNRRLFDIFNLY